MILTDKYCGDAEMDSLLKKYEVKFTLHQLYGLLYVAVSAPEIVQPSQVISIIFNGKEPDCESMEEAKSFLENIMTLWNVVAESTSGGSHIAWPETVFQHSDSGLKEYIHAITSLAEQFIKGLDLGATQEEDFSGEIRDAFESLAKTDLLLKEYLKFLKKDKSSNAKEIAKSFKLVKKVEDIIVDCVGRIAVGLKDSRIRKAREIAKFVESPHQTRGGKVERNAPCPCGSGKKFKKCCGLLH
ncbi:MAG: SEC-C domain-containing protein [Nitrospinae bacterium]|nr:SEC-C domain-containing protein [Nitrospinota bacterium]